MEGGKPGAGVPPAEEPSTSLISLKIIETMLEAPGPWGVSELAVRLGIPKARVHRHLTQLRSAAYVRHDPATRRYEVGWRLVLLGERIAAQSSASTIARPLMDDLRNRVRQTIVFAQVSDLGVVVTEVLPGGSPIDVVLSPGTTFGFNAAAQGKIALAFGSPEQVESWSAIAPETRTDHTIVDEELLAVEIAEARERGWASAPEETYVGVNALAAPILGHSGQLIGTLAIVGSVHYLPDPPPAVMTNALLDTAARLSADFGYDPESPATPSNVTPSNNTEES
ncbi:IclR family transcriptional regulator [Glaciibacter sp. 2TAF33]|uniref:IclR family transcriptional regulator n=1 Tax=Glaciibacter sp. 2TAF33 TaxID=3233015 RepID=UPI003F8E7319